MADVTISLAHRVQRGTLVVSLDGASILNERFSKPKMVLYQTTTWDTLQRAVGCAQADRARERRERQDLPLGARYAVEMARTGNNLLRIGFKRDKLTITSSRASR